MPTRFRHFEYFVTKDFAVGDARQIPASGVTVEIRRLGAVANGGGSFADGVGGAITIRDPGRLRSGDAIVVATAGGVPGTVSRTLTAATETSITVAAGAGAFTWSDGNFFTATNNKPNIYADPVGGGTAIALSQLSTDSRGFAHCWSDEESIDRVESGGGVTTRFVPNLGGTGGSEYSSAGVTTAAGQPTHHFDTKEAIASDQPIARFSNNGVEKADIHGDGSVQLKGGLTIDAGGLTVTAGTVALPAGEIGTAELADAAVTVAKLALNAVADLKLNATDLTDVATVGTTFAVIGGLTVTFTPDSTDSVIVCLGYGSPSSVGGAVTDRALIRIQETTGVTTLATIALTRQDLMLDTDVGERPSVSILGVQTGVSGSRTYQFQQAGAVAGQTIHSNGDETEVRFIVFEFKKSS